MPRYLCIKLKRFYSVGKVQTRVMLGYLCTYIDETVRSKYDRYAANRADPGSGIV